MDSLTRPPLACRWHLHHHWAWFRTDDGEPYERCSRCGEDRDDRPRHGPVDLRSPFGLGM